MISAYARRLSLRWSVTNALADLGAALVEEAEGLIAKAEDYFGRRITRAGLAIICLGAVLTAIKACYNVLSPLVVALADPSLPVGAVLLIVLALMLAGESYFLIYSYFAHRRWRIDMRTMRRMMKDAESAASDAIAANKKAVATYKESIDNQTVTILVLEDAINILENQGSIGQAKAAECRSLLDIVSKTPP